LIGTLLCNQYCTWHKPLLVNLV